LEFEREIDSAIPDNDTLVTEAIVPVATVESIDNVITLPSKRRRNIKKENDIIFEELSVENKLT
jgi:hypothetical protein